MYSVQVGWRGQKYEVKLETDNASQAIRNYQSYLVHSGGKKRLVKDGKVIARIITSRDGVDRVLGD